MTVNSLVDELGQLLELELLLVSVALGQLLRRDGGGDGQMHLPFLLRDPLQDAVQVLAGLLDVLLVLRDVQLLRLQEIAGLVLVGDSHRRDVQLGQVLHEGLGTADREHLEHRTLGQVATVLGAPVALGYPGGLALF